MDYLYPLSELAPKSKEVLGGFINDKRFKKRRANSVRRHKKTIEIPRTSPEDMKKELKPLTRIRNQKRFVEEVKV